MYRSIAITLSICPSFIRRYIRDTASAIYYLISSDKRKNVKNNLLYAGKKVGEISIFNIFRKHTDNILDMFIIGHKKNTFDSENIKFYGKENLDKALHDGRGVILITAHVGNWERAALFLSDLGYELHVVAGIQMNSFFSESVRETKEKIGIHVVNPTHSYRRLFKALNSNGIVVLLLDGDVYREGKVVEFFGKSARMPTGVIKLFRRSGCSLLSGYCRRTGELDLKIVIDDIVDRELGEKMTDEEIIHLLYTELEDIISKNIDQWCIFRKIWEIDR